MPVQNIDYEMLRLFILSPPLLLTSTHIDSPTNQPIQILLPMPFCLYLIIFLIQLMPFTTLLRVSLTNRFVLSLLQLSFYIACALCFVTFCTHLVHMCYALEVQVKTLTITNKKFICC